MTPPLRIAYVIGQLTHGGTEGQLYELVRNLDRDRFIPLVCALSSGGYWADQIRAQGIDVLELQRRGHYDILRFWKLYQLLQRWKPDIVQTMLWSANSYGRIASRLAGVSTVIACERVAGHSKGALKVVVDRLLDRFTDRYIVNAPSVADYLVEGQHRLSRAKIEVIPNGVNATRFGTKTGNAEKRQEFGIAFDEPVIGTIGRLAHQKNQRCFLQACELLRERLPSFKVLIVGEGPLRPALEAQVADLGLSTSVTFTGIRDDVPELFAIMDVFAFSSDSEGLPNVVLEAMAASLPVVATAVGGTGDAVVNGQTGYLVEPGQPGHLAEAILAILTSRELAERLGRAGRERVIREFSIDQMVRNTEAVYLRFQDSRISRTSRRGR